MRSALEGHLLIAPLASLHNPLLQQLHHLRRRVIQRQVEHALGHILQKMIQYMYKKHVLKNPTSIFLPKCTQKNVSKIYVSHQVSDWGSLLLLFGRVPLSPDVGLGHEGVHARQPLRRPAHRRLLLPAIQNTTTTVKNGFAGWSDFSFRLKIQGHFCRQHLHKFWVVSLLTIYPTISASYRR